MKKLLLIGLLGILALPAFSQAPPSAIQGFGALIQKGIDPVFVGYTAANISIATDTVNNVKVFNRTGVFYSDPDSVHGEFLGAWTQAATRFYVPTSALNIYFETGGKAFLISQDGPDQGAGALGLAIGMKIWNAVGVQASYDWMFISGESSRHLVSLAVDFLPRVP